MINLAMSFDCVWTFHASVSKVIFKVSFVDASTSGDMSAFLSASIVFRYSFMKPTSVNSWFFFKLWFKGAASRAKLRTERPIRLHKPKNEYTSVTLPGFFTSLIATAVWDAPSGRLGRVTCLVKCPVSVRNWHFWAWLLYLLCREVSRLCKDDRYDLLRIGRGSQCGLNIYISTYLHLTVDGIRLIMRCEVPRPLLNQKNKTLKAI